MPPLNHVLTISHSAKEPEDIVLLVGHVHMEMTGKQKAWHRNSAPARGAMAGSRELAGTTYVVGRASCVEQKQRELRACAHPICPLTSEGSETAKLRQNPDF